MSADCAGGFFVANHWDNDYNGCYIQAEDWNGFPHYENEANGTHLYWNYDWRFNDGVSGSWAFDDR